LNYLATTDFDPTIMTWNTEPSIAGFPLAAVISTVAGNFDTGLTIGLDQPIYGLTCRMSLGSSLSSPGYIFAPALMVLNA